MVQLIKVVTNNTDISGDTVIDGKTNLNSNVIVEGDISLNKAVDISENLTIKGSTTIISTYRCTISIGSKNFCRMIQLATENPTI